MPHLFFPTSVEVRALEQELEPRTHHHHLCNEHFNCGVGEPSLSLTFSPFSSCCSTMPISVGFFRSYIALKWVQIVVKTGFKIRFTLTVPGRTYPISSELGQIIGKVALSYFRRRGWLKPRSSGSEINALTTDPTYKRRALKHTVSYKNWQVWLNFV